MTYLLYPFAALASLAMALVSVLVLNWIVVLFADGAGNLPRWLAYFQTFDASLDEGMHARRRELQAGIGEEWAAFDPFPLTWFERYRNRALWLLRNPSYGFDYYLFGVRWHPVEWRVTTYIDRPDLTLFIARGRGFNVYYHGRFGMLKIGWKAWNCFNGTDLSRVWGDGTRLPICCTYSPFKRKG